MEEWWRNVHMFQEVWPGDIKIYKGIDSICPLPLFSSVKDQCVTLLGNKQSYQGNRNWPITAICFWKWDGVLSSTPVQYESFSLNASWIIIYTNYVGRIHGHMDPWMDDVQINVPLCLLQRRALSFSPSVSLYFLALFSTSQPWTWSCWDCSLLKI